MNEEITVKALHDAIKELKELKDQHDTASDILDGIKNSLDTKKNQVLSMLQATGKTSESVPGVMNAVLTHKYYVAQPESAEAEAEFNAYLAENNLDSMRKVNSATLTKFVREQFEAAAEKGELANIPGIKPPTIEVALRMNKG
jgi:hypothetical protein